MAYFRSLLDGPIIGAPDNTYTYTLSANDGDSASESPGTSYLVGVYINGSLYTNVNVGDAAGGGDLPGGGATFDVTPGFVGDYVITFDTPHADYLSFVFGELTLVVTVPATPGIGAIMLPGGKALIVGGKFCRRADLCCCTYPTTCPPYDPAGPTSYVFHTMFGGVDQGVPSTPLLLDSITPAARWSNGNDGVTCDGDGWYLALAALGPAFRVIDPILKFAQFPPTSAAAWINTGLPEWVGWTIISVVAS